MADQGDEKELFPTIVHQMRSPLSVALIAQKRLLSNDDDNLTEQQVNMIEQSKKRIEYCLDLVSSLLQPGVINYLTREPELNDTNVEQLLDTVIDSFSIPVDQKQLTVVRQYAADPVPVRVDHEQFRVAIDNLVENAVKYTPIGGTITIITKYEDDSFFLQVSDTGPGLPSGTEHEVFKKFVTFAGDKQSSGGSSGLGLYISAQIVARHNGVISYEPQDTAGSLFSVKIPLTSEK